MMELLQPFILTARLVLFVMIVVGISGLAQSQYYYGAEPYLSPYYDPLFPDDKDDGNENDILSDSELRARIMTDFGINPFVDRDDVSVSVQKKKMATHSGDVDNRSEMIDAVEMAYEAGA